jgi:hypothetical protein
LVAVGGTGVRVPVAVAGNGVFVFVATLMEIVNVAAWLSHRYIGVQPAPNTPILKVYVPAGWLVDTFHLALKV